MKIICGTASHQLATEISQALNQPLLQLETTTFANGERRIWIKDSVKGENIILVQSFAYPTDENIMEFLLIVDALQRGGARHVNAVIPWMGYSLQDKIFRDGEPIAAKVVADLVSQAYVKRAFLLDLHNSSTPGFFAIPTQHLSGLELFAGYIKEHFDLKNSVVASPDFGGLKRARRLAEALDVELVNIDKQRSLHSGEITGVTVHGEVQGKSVLIFDDVINSGSTVVNASEILKSEGAAETHFFATHGIFANNGAENIANSNIDSVVITNSIEHQNLPSKISVISVAEIFAEALSAWA